MTFTEETNALDYLQRAVSFIRECAQDDTAWKWVIIALHGSLYGFAICALKGTDAYSVSREQKDGSRRLISFPEAIKACQDPDRMKMTVFSRPLVLTADQKRAIDKLQKDLRNPFEHYNPSLWSIEIHGITALAIHCLRVIKFLALDTGNYVHLTEEEQNRVRGLVSAGIEQLGAMALHRDYLSVSKGHAELCDA